MKTYKMSIAQSFFTLTIIATLGCFSVCADAADEVISNTTIAAKMDAIGLKYDLYKDGAVETSFNVNGEEIVIAVLPWKDDGSLAIASLYEKEGIRHLRCIVSPECQGAEFKSAIFSFVSAMNEFRSAQQKYTKEYSSGENVNTTATAAPTLTDLNAIPVQYRESNSKVKAWLKQQEYFGKTVSIKARVSMINDRNLLFNFDYANASDSLFGSSLSFTVQPNNYSPLDYNENDVYIISGQLIEDMMWPFKISDPSLQRSK